MTSLKELHAANIARQAEWCPDQVPDLSFRGNELGGECGEAQNVIKKLERERLGWRGSRASLDDLAQELADVVICADLCAVTAGIDLGAAVVAKFNATSEKVGLTTKLAPEARGMARAGAAMGAGDLDRYQMAVQILTGIRGGNATGTTAEMLRAIADSAEVVFPLVGGMQPWHLRERAGYLEMADSTALHLGEELEQYASGRHVVQAAGGVGASVADLRAAAVKVLGACNRPHDLDIALDELEAVVRATPAAPPPPAQQGSSSIRDIGMVGPVNGMNEPDLSGAYMRLVLTRGEFREERLISIGAAEVFVAEALGSLHGPDAQQGSSSPLSQNETAEELERLVDDYGRAQDLYTFRVALYGSGSSTKRDEAKQKLFQAIRSSLGAGHLVPASLATALGSGEGTAGATPAGSGSRPSDQAASHPAPAGFDPSRGWQPITTAPMTTDPILITGWAFADDDWNSGYVGYWRDAPAHKAKERYQCIGYMVQPASGHRCVGHRNGPVNVTHWMPLPPAPCDGSGEAGETHSGSTEGDSAVGVAEAPHPQSPSLSEVEAKAVLAEPYLIRKGGYYYRPNRCGYTATPHDAGHYTREEAEAEASIEPWHMSAVKLSDALATLTASQEQDGEVRS
ncbi:MazG-like family protein [Methylobacterium brachiatum]|uniref:MazG-like family protein n=1 Tax=Methylobacterium brachiatum TaxID=269660 RepID=UPI00197BCDEF|nr:MazG-like family protein [Methylobacterium brachiatum]